MKKKYSLKKNDKKISTSIKKTKKNTDRLLKVNVKTAKGRKISSTNWLRRQLNDPYVKLAKERGYRSRAAFKLLEINEKFHIFKFGDSVIDLGCAPGGWSQVAVEKTNSNLDKLKEKQGRVIGIDHHVDPSFGDVQIIDSDAASTTQVLFRQFKEENIEISKDMANCLLTGLITDTGRFQYSNTTSEVFNIASELLDAGANLSQISENIYGSIEFNALTLQSKIIERIVLKEEINFAHSIVYQNDYSDYQVEPEETDFLIDVVRLVKESNVALLLKEQKDGTFKGSLRSRGDINVQQIASIFDGGGHVAASGFSSNDSPENIIEKIEYEIRKFI